jgi:hypothetical protein
METPEASKGNAAVLPSLLSRDEVQQILCISRKTLWRLVSSGTLPVVYVDSRPRFLPEDVWEFVRSRRRGGGAQ